ncbi:Rieske (2Fe-2S) protein [Actinacidiphila acidipaludis]|uniref:Cytochrome bc1 complex Rieske iron-sulfur subunit n=1 Tax=Actinacidiphila acidipaludis TaxID=2873382 RepID=A0ABS7QGP5_9ACTN|nr:Rieske (2Fe-2S) protein [Streptomyces acidipaludis]MBY8882337.1 Rieske (2Fe-2S) protein [Streptomyces acidipaludis]
MAETPATPGTPGFPESVARRTVVAAAGGAGLAAVLTACGSSGSGSDDSPTVSAGDTTSDAGSTQPSDSAAPTTSAAGSGSSGGGGLAKTSEIPVGGGKVFADQKVVVTQPTAGQFKAFSAVCTHQGCTVASVSGGTINCPCHGSRFHVADGSVANGPAQAPLPSKQVRVAGGEISLA